MKLPLPLANIYLYHIGNSLKCGRDFWHTKEIDLTDIDRYENIKKDE